MTYIRRIAFAALVLIIGSAALACAPVGTDRATVHSSGLTILPDDSSLLYSDVPANLEGAHGALDMLAVGNARDFGYVNVFDGVLTMDVATPRGTATLASFLAGEKPTVGATQGEDPYKKMPGAIAAVQSNVYGVPVATRQVDFNRADREALKDEVTDSFVEDDSLADAGVYQIGVDQSTGRIVVWMRNLTDAVAVTIVAHYGTDIVAVVVNDEIVSGGLD